MSNSPLAHLLRPSSIDDVVGQSHLVEKGKPIRQLVEQGDVFSMIFWGPPGVGKTTLARILATASGRTFIELSAVSASKNDVREVIQAARQPQKGLMDDPRAPVLFLDEIHRFNKAQQDFLLPYVEDGTITLIGATTENPSFEVISPLLSRCRVFVLHELTLEDLEKLIQKVETALDTTLSDDAKKRALRLANGDARQLLTLLDHCWQTFGSITKDKLDQLGQGWLRYDKHADHHYDTISAFIKSLRASQPDAALYYLARMIEGGEDPKFIARRMVIFASEDVGMAQPTALVVANAAFRAVETVGLPEAAINLSHAVVYLATAKKDRRAYDALRAAQADVRKHGNLEIPHKIRNAPTDLMKEIGYGKDYEMYDTDDYLPAELKGKRYFSK